MLRNAVGYRDTQDGLRGHVGRRRLLTNGGVAGLAAMSALVASAAQAQNECGAPAGATVTCTSAGNPYAGGVTYTSATDLTVATNPDVVAQGTIRVTGTTANVAVSNAGTVNVTAANAPGVALSSGTASASLTTTGAITSAAGDGADISAGTTAALTVGAKGAISGQVNGVVITSVAPITLNNSGTITGDTVLGKTGYAISTTGGKVTLNNSGTIIGPLNFSALGNVITNSGTFTTKGLNDLGVGATTFTNTGTVSILPDGVAGAQVVGLIGPGTFNNSGLLDERNGRAGDTLNLAGTFKATGGSQVGLDVQLGGAGSLADKLVVTAPTGATSIVLADVGAGPGALNSGILLVQASAGATATSFTLAGGPIEKGFIQYNLVFNSTTNAYELVGLPGAPAYQTLKFTAGAESVWHASSDAWSTHMSELRDGRWEDDPVTLQTGFHPWAQVFGASTRRSESETYDVFNQSQQISLSYHQDFEGFETGFDLIGRHGPVDLIAGLSAGYTHSNLRFPSADGNVGYSTPNVAGYASALLGGGFLNVLVKYDHDELSASSGLASYGRDFSGNSYGVTGEAGYRFSLGHVYAEPLGSIGYVRSDLDGFSAQGASFDLNSGDSALGKLGGRLGADFRFANGMLVAPYVGGHVVKEFDGQDAVDFSSGGYTLHFTDRRPGAFGQAEFGLDFTSWRRLSGFIQMDGDFAGHTDGLGGRLGIRLAL